MSYQITGEIKTLSEVVAKTEKFTVQTVVLETFGDNDRNRQYPQLIELQASNSNIEHLDGFKVGDEVTISFDIRGRSWQRSPADEVRYFNSLNLYRCEASRVANQPAPRAVAPKAPAKSARPALDSVDDSESFIKSLPDNDLPF